MIYFLQSMECLYQALSETNGPRLEGLDLVSIFLNFSSFSVLGLLEEMVKDL